MKKTVLVLTIAGGVIGVTGNFIFYIFGSITTGIQNTIFKGILPGLDLSKADAEIQRILLINTVTASLLCIAGAIAGYFYFRGDKNEGEKKPEKYIFTVVLIALSAGLIITMSFISLILIGAAAIISSISVVNDFKDGVNADTDKLKKSMIVTALLSTVVLISLYFISKISVLD